MIEFQKTKPGIEFSVENMYINTPTDEILFHSSDREKKSLAQEVRQKSDISERRSKGLLCLQHVQLCHCATCRGSSDTKNECSLFYQKFDAEYFFIRQFFRKKLYFQREPQKTVLRAHLTIF